MNSRRICTLLFFSITVLFLFCPHESHADKSHPFYNDVKEAYADSKLIYDSRVERYLYSVLPKPGYKLPEPRNAEEEMIVKQAIGAVFQQFFKRVKTGGNYCPIEKIKDHFGQSPKERIGISSGGYYRLFIAYWTLNIKLEENRKENVSKHGYGNFYYIDGLLRFVESTLAGAFFPSPGPIVIPESLRRENIQNLLDRFAPTMTIKELYEGADSQKVGWPVLK